MSRPRIPPDSGARRHRPFHFALPRRRRELLALRIATSRRLRFNNPAAKIVATISSPWSARPLRVQRLDLASPHFVKSTLGSASPRTTTSWASGSQRVPILLSRLWSTAQARPILEGGRGIASQPGHKHSAEALSLAEAPAADIDFSKQSKLRQELFASSRWSTWLPLRLRLDHFRGHPGPGSEFAAEDRRTAESGL